MGQFLIKKIIFALRFRRFRDNRGAKWGSIKHPSAYIYIYIKRERKKDLERERKKKTDLRAKTVTKIERQRKT